MPICIRIFKLSGNPRNRNFKHNNVDFTYSRVDYWLENK